MPAPIATKPAYSVEELCRFTSLGRSIIYQEIRRGHLKAVKLGRRTLILASEVERWLNTLPASSPSSTGEGLA